MREFKIGDEAWFFWTDCGKYVWTDSLTGIFPKNLYIEHGTIVGMNVKKDFVHVYIHGEQENACFGYDSHDEYFFESKNKAIEEMTKRLQELSVWPS